ncbi:hypothetical protein BJ508DRAFT_311015 [Ascobolus immersus RN42]|uniref:Uncharacterized protein n=1 Tax=Ascobolus immersus RN42 TaxID=1160509 RepID=A0A3N4HVE8_ASCIM|nr:hypothetical protein BJ508DRAFT_311015 [Ascobolus immersus RN42]
MAEIIDFNEYPESEDEGLSELFLAPKPKICTSTERHDFAPGSPIEVSTIKHFDPNRICAYHRCLRKGSDHITGRFEPTDYAVKCMALFCCTAWLHLECHEKRQELARVNKNHLACRSDEERYTVRVNAPYWKRLDKPQPKMYEFWEIPSVWESLGDAYGDDWQWTIIERECLSEYDCAFPSSNLEGSPEIFVLDFGNLPLLFAQLWIGAPLKARRLQFTDLPRGVRSAIANHLDNWDDFNAFRQIDYNNYQLLTTDEMITRFPFSEYDRAVLNLFVAFLRGDATTDGEARIYQTIIAAADFSFPRPKRTLSFSDTDLKEYLRVRRFDAARQKLVHKQRRFSLKGGIYPSDEKVVECLQAYSRRDGWRFHSSIMPLAVDYAEQKFEIYRVLTQCRFMFSPAIFNRMSSTDSMAFSKSFFRTGLFSTFTRVFGAWILEILRPRSWATVEAFERDLEKIVQDLDYGLDVAERLAAWYFQVNDTFLRGNGLEVSLDGKVICFQAAVGWIYKRGGYLKRWNGVLQV